MSVKYVVTIHTSDDKSKPVNAKIIDFTFESQRAANEFFLIVKLMKSCKLTFDHANHARDIERMVNSHGLNLDKVLKNHSRSFYIIYVRDVRAVKIKKQES